MEQNPELIPPDRDTPDVPQTSFDPLDPHGQDDHEHGHVVVPMRILVGVLVLLLVFTALTVFASQFEIWISDVFATQLPQWVNVSVAMSIAVVKGLFVVLYFMQLRYDKGLNAIIFAFCLLTVGIFMGFSTLDLFSRGEVYRFQRGEIVTGGTGGFRDVPTGMSVSDWSRRRQREADAHHGEHIDHERMLSSPQRSINMYGPLVFAATHDDHADPHQGPHEGGDAPQQERPDGPLTPAGDG